MSGINYSDLFVWSNSPVYALIAESRGFASYHVSGGDRDSIRSQSTLRQSLHDLEAVWQCNEIVSPHVFLHPSPTNAQTVEFDAMRSIAEVLRGRGAEVIEVQLSSSCDGGEWLPNSYELTPNSHYIDRVHELLDLLSVYRGIAKNDH